MNNDPVKTYGWTVDQWVNLRPNFTYHFTRMNIAWWINLGWRLKFYGSELVPRDSSSLYVSNHSSWLDSWIQALGHRVMPRFMGKEELFKFPGVREYLRSGGVFPVARGKSDAAAINIAELLLENEAQVVVYPEGTRIQSTNSPTHLGRPRSGAARLALTTGAAIQPVATYGLKNGTGREHLKGLATKLPFNRRIITIYGELFSVEKESNPTRERVIEVRDEIWSRITELYTLARSMSTLATLPKSIVLPSGREVLAGRQ